MINLCAACGEPCVVDFCNIECYNEFIKMGGEE